MSKSVEITISMTAALQHDIAPSLYFSKQRSHDTLSNDLSIFSHKTKVTRHKTLSYDLYIFSKQGGHKTLSNESDPGSNTEFYYDYEVSIRLASCTSNARK